jgi:adenine-specific DNA-methyltransferase
MMYPRLYLAKNLLREDGFIVVSIDDNELYNLTLLMNEVIGDENYLATLIWDRNRKNDAKIFSVGHEYMVVYAKNKLHLTEMGLRLRAPKEGVEEVREEFERLRKLYNDDWDEVAKGLRQLYETYDEDDPRRPLARYTKVDSGGPYRTDGDPSWPGGGGPRYDVPHPRTRRACKVPSRGWVWPTYERMKEEIDKGLICFGEDETTIPSVRRNLFDKDEQVMRSVMFSYAQKAAQDFAKIFEGRKLFDNPKSYRDLQKLVSYLTDKDDLIVDFFAGSCTTAHGVMEANKNDQGRRRFIMVQLPEKCDESSEAFKAGYKNIADLGKDRMRRVAGTLIDEAKTHLNFESLSILAIGFRVLKLDRSNFKTWQGDADTFDESGKQLVMHVDHLSPESSAEDVLYELLLKAGFPLTTKVKTIEMAGKQVFSIEDDALLICLEKEVTPELIDALADAEPLQVICLDAAFKGNDQMKANAVQTFKARAQAEESEIVFKTV